MFNRNVRKLMLKLVLLIAMTTCLVALGHVKAASDDCCCEDCYSGYWSCINGGGGSEYCADQYNSCASGCNDADPEGPVCPLMQ